MFNTKAVFVYVGLLMSTGTATRAVAAEDQRGLRGEGGLFGNFMGIGGGGDGNGGFPRPGARGGNSGVNPNDGPQIPGGPGPAGGPPPRGPPFPPGIKFYNDTCVVDANADPACTVGPPGQEVEGAWVCRTLYDVVSGESDTFSACVDMDHFIETDACNCCDGVCPQTDLCGCSCNLDEAAADNSGVLITMVGAPDDADAMLCVPPEVAYHKITGPGFFGRAICVEECPAASTP
jgi:hypothetical protein